MKLQQRVKVDIVEPERYAIGCAECLDGATGTIIVYDPLVDKWCVKFDEPRQRWWSNQMPVKCFWFQRDELITCD